MRFCRAPYEGGRRPAGRRCRRRSGRCGGDGGSSDGGSSDACRAPSPARRRGLAPPRRAAHGTTRSRADPRPARLGQEQELAPCPQGVDVRDRIARVIRERVVLEHVLVEQRRAALAVGVLHRVADDDARRSAARKDVHLLKLRSVGA
eukprot:scaffold21068_cov66-Phaeocystis_antarctica.AAC.5